MGEKGTINSEGRRGTEKGEGSPGKFEGRSLGKRSVGSPLLLVRKRPFHISTPPPFDSPWGGGEGNEFVFFFPCVLKEASPVGVFDQRANGRSKVVGLDRDGPLHYDLLYL